MDEGYLDELVVSYIIRNIGFSPLQDVPREKRTEAFLTRLVREQQHQIIGDALSVLLADVTAFPQGTFYVVLPNDHFKYEKKGDGLDCISNGRPVLAGEGFKGNGIKTGIAALFFNQEAKEGFERKIEDSFANTTGFHIAGYGKIMLYTYEAAKLVASR